MQVFIPWPEPILVAQTLDPRRLNKQIIECNQIISAICQTRLGNTNAPWRNHPVVKMYSQNMDWLLNYKKCLESWMLGDHTEAKTYNIIANSIKPDFITPELCDQHKRRLYTKAPLLYHQFAQYGVSEENWYVVDGLLVKYIRGKKI